MLSKTGCVRKGARPQDLLLVSRPGSPLRKGESNDGPGESVCKSHPMLVPIIQRVELIGRCARKASDTGRVLFEVRENAEMAKGRKNYAAALFDAVWRLKDIVRKPVRGCKQSHRARPRSTSSKPAPIDAVQTESANRRPRLTVRLTKQERPRTN